MTLWRATLVLFAALTSGNTFAQVNLPISRHRHQPSERGLEKAEYFSIEIPWKITGGTIGAVSSSQIRS